MRTQQIDILIINSIIASNKDPIIKFAVGSVCCAPTRAVKHDLVALSNMPGISGHLAAVLYSSPFVCVCIYVEKKHVLYIYIYNVGDIMGV